MKNNEQYRVWCETWFDDEGQCDLIMAYDHSEAAEKFAQASHDNDAFHSPITVSVRCTFGGDDGELKKFTVHPDYSVSFCAYEVKE